MKAAAFHPINTKREAELPFYITSIGITPEEHRIYRPEGIENFQILYTKKGMGRARLFNRFTDVPEKSLLVLPPNVPHYYEMQGESWETCWITFGGWAAEKFFDVDASVISLPDEFDFEQRFNEILSLRKSQEWSLQSSALLYSLLLDCKEFVPENTASAYKLRTQLKESLRYIHNNYKDVIELSHLAKISGITREHLCRIFKQYTGMRPFEYITKIRLQKAQELLVLNREMTISEVGKRTGFQSSSYFSAVFRKNFGCTAEEYRKREA